jgi:L-asparaginase
MAKPRSAPFRVALISTGGTIEKTYNELHGVLTNDVSVLDVMLASLELGDTEIERVTLMNKDSLDMTEEDHQLIADTALHKSREFDGVIIVHGTDRLAVTGETIYDLDPKPKVPIILTGAMRPYELRTSDSMQNLVEALFAVQLAKRGVFVAMHNKLLSFPGVRKDAGSGTFVKE